MTSASRLALPPCKSERTRNCNVVPTSPAARPWAARCRSPRRPASPRHLLPNSTPAGVDSCAYRSAASTSRRRAPSTADRASAVQAAWRAASKASAAAANCRIAEVPSTSPLPPPKAPNIGAKLPSIDVCCSKSRIAPCVMPTACGSCRSMTRASWCSRTRFGCCNMASVDAPIIGPAKPIIACKLSMKVDMSTSKLSDASASCSVQFVPSQDHASTS
mmetsp:Transcript_147863/g.474679  ORF Transcript_147863/g.474679 Transcript_147863/m.474679 type:complete len:218 (+) Transcript_147863:1080-1733(+)